jgi:hypothetical protein
MAIRLSWVRAFVLFAAFTLPCAGTAEAQFRASIQGTVTDASGGAVPGVAVVVTNQDTGVSSETVTSESGFYRVSALAPGRYSVKASLSGFKEAVAEGVAVGAEEARGLDLTLETGNLQETVTVTAAPPTLRTENADIAGTFSTVEIKSLPQSGRDPYELVRLAPGVFGLGARDGAGNSVGVPNQAGPGGSNSSVFQTENQVPVSANGQRVEANNFQLDGVTSMSQAWGGAAVVTPNQESVKEIRVISSSYSAENGRNTGATVQVVSQNGTNDLHGSLVFKRNTPGLNSYQSDDWVGPAGELPERVNRRLSQTGGSLGGPIWRNKLFFFFSFETSNSKRQTLATEWVETPELVNAIKGQRPNSIATQFLNYPGTTPPKISNVLNTVDVGSLSGGPGQTVASPLGGGLDGIPDLQRVQLEGFENQSARQFNVRVDYSVTPADLVAFSAYFVPVDTDSNDPAVWGNTARPVGDFTSERRNMVGTLLWTRTLSPTMLNEARFNVTRWYFDEVASNPEQPWGLPRLWVNQPVGTENPLVSYGPGIGPGVFYQTTYNIRDTLTKVINTHALKIGADVIFEQNNDKAPWAGTPEYHFSSLWNFANDAPFDEVAFFDPTNGEFTDLASYARTNYYALYVQDDWKVRPNLTVNAGLRWEYFSPLKSKNDQISNLILGANGGLVDARLQVGGELYEKDTNNFGPQIGAAWTPDVFGGRAVVRGGFGVAYNRLPGSRLLESRFNPPFFAGFTLTGSNVDYRTASDPNGFDYPANSAAVLTFDPATGLPSSGPPVNVNATAQELPNPYTYRYSADADYEIGRGWVASVGYQGSRGNNLARPVPYQLFVAPNPRLGSVNLLLTDVDSKYNALLTRLTRRYADGYALSVEYRLGKSTDTCSSDQNCRQTYPFDQATEEGPSDFDVRHTFKLFGSWDLPILRDRRDALGLLLGGWQVSGIVTAASGYPWTPVFGGGLCQAAVAGGGVCPLRPIDYTGGALGDTSNDVFLQQWGQFPGGPLQYFTPPPPGSFTEVPRPGVGRNSFRGPNYFSVDATLLKRFGLPAIPGLGNNVNLEVRANAYNVFNTLNLKPLEFNTRSTQIENSAFGQADKALSGRVVEFQGRFSF